MSLDIVNGDAVLLSIHFNPTKCLHQPGAVSPLLQYRSLQTNSDLREPLEYNWSWEESGATSLSSEAVEVRTHPVLLAPPISKPTSTVDKWQAIFCRPIHQSKTAIGGLQFLLRPTVLN